MTLNKTISLPLIKRGKFVILGLFIMIIIGTVYSYSVFRVALEDYYGIGASLSGLPYMFALATYALFMMLSGPYISKIHPRTMMLVGGALVSLGWILSSFSPHIGWFTFFYGFISGSGVGIMYGVPMAVVAKWFPDHRGLAVGSVIVGFGLSPIVTAPLANQLILSLGVMNALLFLGLGLAVLLPILVFPFRFPNSNEVQTTPSLSTGKGQDMPTKFMMKQRRFKGLYLNFVLGTTIGLMLIGLTANIGRNIIGLTSTQVSQAMALFALLNGGGRPLFGWLVDRFGSFFAMMLSYSLITVASLLMIFFGEANVFIYIVSFMLFWLNLGAWLAIAPTTTINDYGVMHYSQNYGLLFTAYGVGAILGVLSSGLVIDWFSNIQTLFVIVIVFSGLGIINTIITFKE